jgi:DNA modification methylase
VPEVYQSDLLVSHLKDGTPENLGKPDMRYAYPVFLYLESNEECMNDIGESNLVLDTFCGSGPTAEAAKITGNNFIGFEFDRASVETVRERILNAERGYKVKQCSLFQNNN